MENKKIVSAITKTHKVTMAVLGLFLATVGVLAFLKEWKTKNIAGQWRITFTNQSSSYKPYIGETHTQKVFFSQNKNSITGNGEKWEYNGKLLPFDEHRKIEYNGFIDGDQLKATFKLYGLKRES